MRKDCMRPEREEILLSVRLFHGDVFSVVGLHQRLGIPCPVYQLRYAQAATFIHVWYDLLKPRVTNFSFNICHCFHCQTFTLDKVWGSRARRWSSSLDKSIFAILSPGDSGNQGPRKGGWEAVVCARARVKFQQSIKNIKIFKYIIYVYNICIQYTVFIYIYTHIRVCLYSCCMYRSV